MSSLVDKIYSATGLFSKTTKGARASALLAAISLLARGSLWLRRNNGDELGTEDTAAAHVVLPVLSESDMP